MSHNAMSMPLMVWVSDPPRPIQKELAWSFSLTRSGSSGFSPRYSGSRTPSAPRTRTSFVNTEPHPVMPSSVYTATSVWTQSSGRSSLLQPPSGVLPRSPADLMSMIFTRAILSLLRDDQVRTGRRRDSSDGDDQRHHPGRSACGQREVHLVEARTAGRCSGIQDIRRRDG